MKFSKIFCIWSVKRASNISSGKKYKIFIFEEKVKVMQQSRYKCFKKKKAVGFFVCLFVFWGLFFC